MFFNILITFMNNNIEMDFSTNSAGFVELLAYKNKNTVIFTDNLLISNVFLLFTS